MFNVIIAQLDRVLYQGDADSVTLPGKEGEMTVLKNHIPLVSPLRGGAITVRRGDHEETFQVLGGILEVSRAGVTVLL